MVSPHLFLSANGYRDRVDSLCGCNELLVASTLLSLTHRRETELQTGDCLGYISGNGFKSKREIPFFLHYIHLTNSENNYI